MRLIQLLILTFLFLSCADSPTFTEQDKSDIQAMMEDYRAAWMDGDSARVMGKVSSEVTLFLPTPSTQPVTGRDNLADYWFPSSDLSYPIYEYEISNEEITGSGNLAYLQGISRLSWCVLENNVARDSTTNISEYLTVVRKEEGEWKIYRQIFNMKDENYSR